MSIEDFLVPDLDDFDFNAGGNAATERNYLAAAEGDMNMNMNMNHHGNMYNSYGGQYPMQTHHHQQQQQQHFTPRQIDVAGYPPTMFPPVHQTMLQNSGGSFNTAPGAGMVMMEKKPTAAQAAAGRLQRASVRHAAKAAQLEKRRTATGGKKVTGNKRKELPVPSFEDAFYGTAHNEEEEEEEEEDEDEDEEEEDEDDEEEGEEDTDDALVPIATTVRGKQQGTNDTVSKKKGNAKSDDTKERKRLKRLLRNRVSAQQARERKKAYMSTLEEKHNEYERKIAELHARVGVLERENGMLRTVVKTATAARMTPQPPGAIMD